MIRAWVVTAVLLTAVSTAAAQSRKGDAAEGKRTNSGPTALLTRISPLDLLIEAPIREELKLTPAQESRRKECMEKVERLREEGRKSLQELGEEPDPHVLAAFRQQQRDAMLALGNGVERAMLQSLDRRQRKRLDQIGIQKEGASAFSRPVIQELLNMDAGQVEAVLMINAQGRREIRQAREVPPDLAQKAILPPAPGQTPGLMKIDPKYAEEFRSAIEKGAASGAKIRDTMAREIVKLLTKKQRQTYQALCGEPFDLASLRKTPSPPRSKDEAKAP